jgi:hypothetical protein
MNYLPSAQRKCREHRDRLPQVLGNGVIGSKAEKLNKEKADQEKQTNLECDLKSKAFRPLSLNGGQIISYVPSSETLINDEVFQLFHWDEPPRGGETQRG